MLHDRGKVLPQLVIEGPAAGGYPSVIVLGGMLALSSESLVAGVREVVYGRSLPLATGNLRIVASQTGEHAGVLGAATMVVQHVLSPEQVDGALAEAQQTS